MKRNKKSMLATACVMVVGVLLLVWGFFCNIIVGWFSKPFYPSIITPDDIGKQYTIQLSEDMFGVETDGVYIHYLLDSGVSEEDSIGYWYTFDVSGISSDERMQYNAYINQNIYEIKVDGILRECSDSGYDKAKQAGIRWLTDYYNEVVIGYGMDIGITLDEFVEGELVNFPPYYIEVTGVGSINGTPFKVIGMVLILLTLLLEICFWFNLKKRIVLPIIFIVFVVIPGVVLFDHIRTAVSVKMVDYGFYTMKNYECTKTQELMKANISSIEDFASWAVKKHFFNLPIEMNEKNFGCAAFAATTADGQHLFGRNFDYDETDMVLVYSHPKGSYASIGMADLTFLGIGDSCKYSVNSLEGRFLMIVEPYAVMDGINEKGVGVGILELRMDEVHQEQGKSDMLVYTAMRAILDNCDSVDAALSLLDSYDIHTGLEHSYHLFITDTTGKYVVVEWLDGEMVITETPAVTNCVVASGAHFGEGTIDRRLGAITAELNSRDAISEEDAMYILSVAHDPDTEWSCVYNLEEFSVDVCMDGNYDSIYSFWGRDFE